MQTLKLALGLFSILLTSPTFAHDADKVGELTGKNVNLFYSDHTLSGVINGKLVFATPLENEFGIKLVYRSQEKNLESVFKKGGDGRISGTIDKTEFWLTKTVAKENLIEGKVGGEPFKVTILADKMDGNHYIDPKYEVTYNNQTFTFSLKNGEACIGCSTKILFVVLGMLKATAGI